MLRIGDMSDSIFEPAVLLWGDANDLRFLSAALRMLTSEGQSVRLSDLEQCLSADGTVLFVRIANAGRGVTIQKNDVPATYVWEIRPKDLPDFVEKIDVLAGSDGSGHQYLESLRPGESIIIIVSKGEYPDDFLSADST
jgi:hypothetical protein